MKSKTIYGVIISIVIMSASAISLAHIGDANTITNKLLATAFVMSVMSLAFFSVKLSFEHIK